MPNAKKLQSSSLNRSISLFNKDTLQRTTNNNIDNQTSSNDEDSSVQLSSTLPKTPPLIQTSSSTPSTLFPNLSLPNSPLGLFPTSNKSVQNLSSKSTQSKPPTKQSSSNKQPKNTCTKRKELLETSSTSSSIAKLTASRGKSTSCQSARFAAKDTIELSAVDSNDKDFCEGNEYHLLPAQLNFKNLVIRSLSTLRVCSS